MRNYYYFNEVTIEKLFTSKYRIYDKTLNDIGHILEFDNNIS